MFLLLSFKNDKSIQCTFKILILNNSLRVFMSFWRISCLSFPWLKREDSFHIPVNWDCAETVFPKQFLAGNKVAGSRSLELISSPYCFWISHTRALMGNLVSLSSLVFWTDERLFNYSVWWSECNLAVIFFCFVYLFFCTVFNFFNLINFIKLIVNLNFTSSYSFTVLSQPKHSLLLIHHLFL